MKLRLLLGCAAPLLAFLACSGASGSELFSPPESSELGTDPGSSNGEGSSGTASSSGTSGSSGLSSTGGPSSSSGSTSSGGSSSGSSGSSSGETKDAGKDSAPPPAPGASIYCGQTVPGTTCNAGSQICCGRWNGSNKPKFACEPTGLVACAGGTDIACDDRTDCPAGQVCCGTLPDGSGYTSVGCKTTCNNFPGVRAVRFCDPKAAVDECAAIGQFCGPSQSLPGYNVCRD